jgi:ABC-type antimicrobial peptide transport system permease subunit
MDKNMKLLVAILVFGVVLDIALFAASMVTTPLTGYTTAYGITPSQITWNVFSLGSYITAFIVAVIVIAIAMWKPAREYLVKAISA